MGQALLSPSELIEGRITRLLETDAGAGATDKQHREVTLRASAVRVCGLLLAYTGVLALALVLMGCGPMLVS